MVQVGRPGLSYTQINELWRRRKEGRRYRGGSWRG